MADLKRARSATAALTLAAMVLAAGAACAGSGGPEAPEGYGALPPKSVPVEFVGDWRVYSETIFFDAGGSGGTDSGASTTRQLSLSDDGTWEFGGSTGRWYVTSIDADDWAGWGVEAYGPDRKMTLEGWNDDVGSGPAEESAAGVDFFWVIYRVDEPDPGVVHVKFGHP